MELVVSGTKVFLEQSIVDKSPLLSNLNGQVIKLSIKSFNTYLDFVQNNNITDVEGLESVLNYMGHDHPRNYGYKNEYYKALLLDWWLNEMMPHHVSFKPFKEKYEFVTQMLGSDDYCISGSSALSLLCDSITPKDIDVFLLEHNADEIVEHAIEYCKKKSITYSIHAHVINVKSKVGNIQIVMKKHKTMYDIVKNFDVDCCCTLLHKNVAYVSRRGEYAINNKINHFNIDNYTPAYCNRLLRYNGRGFNVFLPGIDVKSINVPELNELIRIKASQMEFIEIPWLDSSSDPHILGRYLDIVLPRHDLYDPMSKLLIVYAYGIKCPEDIITRDFYSSEEELYYVPQWNNDVFKFKFKFEHPKVAYSMADIM